PLSPPSVLSVKIRARSPCTQSVAYSSSLPGQVLVQGGPLALAQRHHDPQLLQVLLERLAAEVHLPLAAEGVDLALPLRRRQAGHPFEHPPEARRRVLAIHPVPVLPDELPRRPPPVDAQQERADHERGVLGADLAAERAAEGLLDQVG